MKNLIAAGMLVALIAIPSGSPADEISRFKPLRQKN